MSIKRKLRRRIAANLARRTLPSKRSPKKIHLTRINRLIHIWNTITKLRHEAQVVESWLENSPNHSFPWPR